MIRFFVILLLIASLSNLFAVTVMAPDNPSSLPLIIAADNLPELEVKLFSNHSQAHSLFLGGKVPLLMTGYAVGESFARRDVPIKMIASWVSGMNYLVSADSVYSGFKELKGEKIYFPFKGSPIETMSLWLAAKEGVHPADLQIGYLPFASMLQMMRQDEIKFAVMPLSSALQIVDEQDFFFSFDLNDKWEDYTGSSFYPQVCLFANPQADLSELLPKLKAELIKSVILTAQNPQEAQYLAGNRLSFTPQTVRLSLDMLRFDLLIEEELQSAMEVYFEKSGIAKPPAAFYQAH